jgi:hypothetical protein
MHIPALLYTHTCARAVADMAHKLIVECGYNRRDEERTELEDVAVGRRRFAALPPRV